MTYTPTQLNQYIKGRMDTDPILSKMLVRGELSNYKMYPSGHHYFSLKDSEGTVRCVMFRGNAAALRFRPENGMQVIAAGRVSVFPRDGQYQLYCDRLTPEGAGELAVAFEQLKKKLAAEGLFDPARKKPLPRFPQKIALVTSVAGAAVRDMIRILGVRYPLAEVILVPVLVQGEGAAQDIAAALDLVNENRLSDIIITGRGGGSMEDLWAFNEECVARAISRSQIPVISAVGHEPDVTIADFVADVRASTPSNAAELAVPDQNDLYTRLGSVQEYLRKTAAGMLGAHRQRLTFLAQNPALQNPERYFEGKRLLLDYQSQALTHVLEQYVNQRRERLGRLAASLEAMSPLKVLGRGYTIAQTTQGQVVASVRQLAPGDLVHLKWSDGAASCRVEEIKTGEMEYGKENDL
ncbi:MAG: exodeoxyribonuclease VII large subunit [Oscillospiraceae bacterium]|nr:exodeoxyribonuclease VII large subunit [Oscillospiraceae bacterium]